MVRAILEGRKTQTRRPIRPVPMPGLKAIEPVSPGYFAWLHPSDVLDMPFACPYGAIGGDLWVREVFAVNLVECARGPLPKHRPSAITEQAGIVYRADGEMRDQFEQADGDLPWRPPLHMPRWASRLNLRVTSIRAQRLQNISREDVRAEGIPETYGECDGYVERHFPKTEPHEWDNMRFGQQWQMCWDSINGKRAPWSSNPWVWAITFERLETAALLQENPK
jgi:hypothetical protein